MEAKVSIYRYKGWIIAHKGNQFTAHKGAFFTGYYICDTTGQFIDILNKRYGRI